MSTGSGSTREFHLEIHWKCPKEPNIGSLFKPLPAQQKALDLFLKQEGLRIDAYAGTGKTRTLQYLAANSKQRALYLAFNKSIALEAQSRFPPQVTCATIHSIAFRGVKQVFGLAEWKLTESLSANRIAEAFRFPEIVSFQSGLLLSRSAYAAALLRALKRFCESADEEPQPHHIESQGVLANLEKGALQQFSGQALFHLTAIWQAMREKDAGLPLGHDGYLKLWALSRPRAGTDYIMVDEAQDLNPVLLGVLRNLNCPILYVGDPYQQIYEWRGAVNAMLAVPFRHRVLLSQSFRFGPEIASAASAVLNKLGAGEPLVGSPNLISHLARVRPDVILARSNSGVIKSVLACLERNLRCAVVGGTRDLKRLLMDVQRIKQGRGATAPELLGFRTWNAVMSFSSRPEGDSLRSLVNLVQEHGEGRMLAALERCEETEGSAQIVCSTAHRAKGREWDYVRLDSDFETGLGRAEGILPSQRQAAFAAEARLLYVAMTRARLGLHLSRDLQKRFRLRNTTTAILGTRQQPVEWSGSTEASQRAEGLSLAISPYHSDAVENSKDIAALKRFFS